MACACKGKRNAGVTKTPIRKSNISSNGRAANQSSKRIIRREFK